MLARYLVLTDTVSVVCYTPDLFFVSTDCSRSSALGLFAGIVNADERPRIAIIIDDLGYELALGRRVTELPGPVACAVLPGAPRAKTLAEAAQRNGKEVLLHLPLQALQPAASSEPDVLSLDMSRGQFAAAFAQYIESVPHIVGVNTHRGSAADPAPGAHVVVDGRDQCASVVVLCR